MAEAKKAAIVKEVIFAEAVVPDFNSWRLVVAPIKDCRRRDGRHPPGAAPLSRWIQVAPASPNSSSGSGVAASLLLWSLLWSLLLSGHFFSESLLLRGKKLEVS